MRPAGERAHQALLLGVVPRRTRIAWMRGEFTPEQRRARGARGAPRHRPGRQLQGVPLHLVPMTERAG